MTKLPRRPNPPARLLAEDLYETRLEPAADLKEWVQAHILATDGALHNPEHAHLLEADLQFLWASRGFEKQGRVVLGQAEEVAIRAGGWQKARQEQQLRDWFGHVPDFLITLDAGYCNGCTDAAWCALVEHELYHVAHKLNADGQPMFTQDGAPKLALRGHDVEEFVGVVKRYGVGDPNGAIAQLAAAARGHPQVSRSNIAGACGTCLLRAA